MPDLLSRLWTRVILTVAYADFETNARNRSGLPPALRTSGMTLPGARQRGIREFPLARLDSNHDPRIRASQSWIAAVPPAGRVQNELIKAFPNQQLAGPAAIVQGRLQ